MLRTLLLVLVLANALLLAATSGLFDGGRSGEREPERLQRQHQPQLVRILDAPAASAALAAASAAVAASAASAADPVGAASGAAPGAASAVAAVAASAAASAGVKAAVASAPVAACLEAGPFPAAELATAERSLRDAGITVGAGQAVQTVATTAAEGGWMVYMGRYADRETLQRKLAELKRLRLDGEDLRTPDLQPGISLGRFDTQDAAQAALNQLARRGVRTARVIALRQPQPRTLLRAPAADAALRARLAGLQLPSGPGFVACAAPGAAPASSATGAAAAGTTAAPRPVVRPAATAPSAAGASTRAALARAASAAAVDSASGPAR